MQIGPLAGLPLVCAIAVPFAQCWYVETEVGCACCVLQDLVSPVLLGQEHLPALVGSNRPLLFVGNHQKMGLYDVSVSCSTHVQLLSMAGPS